MERQEEHLTASRNRQWEGETAKSEAKEPQKETEKNGMKCETPTRIRLWGGRQVHPSKDEREEALALQSIDSSGIFSGR